jgi:hypothetical protein
VLVGADGSNSFVRRYCNISMMSEGVDYACGVAYNIPADVSSSDEPLHQALNCILNVSQTRYMVSSLSSRQGYLYIRLIRNEYDELRERLQQVRDRNEPLNLLDCRQCPQSPLWSMIRQGLEFFKISQKFVSRIAPIEINVQHAGIVVRELRFEMDESQEILSLSKTDDPCDCKDKPFKTMLAFLIGDAAMNVHFWPGRGMNSGMKAAMALARNIVRAYTSKTPPHSIEVRTPLAFSDFIKYEGFMACLRAREQQGRSLRILGNPIGQSVQQAHINAHLEHCFNGYLKKLYQKLRDARQHFQEQSDWPHKSIPVTDKELNDAINRISNNAVAQLSLANPWPTREMSGAEVFVQDIFPFSQQQFLPIPEADRVTVHNSLPTIPFRHRFILWIVGDKIDESTKVMINKIRASSKFADPSSTTANGTDQLYNSSIEGLHKLYVVHTIAQAQDWIVANRATILQQNIRFKVITAWSLNQTQTAVDVIQAVRTQIPHVPTLVFTNKHEETQPTIEFPYVIITDKKSNLYEFVGIKQDTQWNTGYPVSFLETTAGMCLMNNLKMIFL